MIDRSLASSVLAFAGAWLLLAGCASVDPRASTEVVDREKTRTLAGDFANYANYRTRGEFIAAATLAELFHVPSKDADRVRIVLDASGLRLTWFQANWQWETVTFPSAALRTLADGSIELAEKSTGGSAEGSRYAGRESLRLFVNSSGELAVIRTSNAVGAIGIVPVGMHTHHLSLFPRIGKQEPAS